MDLGNSCAGAGAGGGGSSGAGVGAEAGVAERLSGGVAVLFFAMCSTRAAARAGSFRFLSMTATVVMFAVGYKPAEEQEEKRRRRLVYL